MADYEVEEKGPRKRAKTDQIHMLVELVEQDPTLHTGTYVPPFAPLSVQKKRWEEAAEVLNSLGPPWKDADSWKEAWRDLKNRTNKRRRTYHQSPIRANVLNEIERRVIAILKASGCDECPDSPDPEAVAAEASKGLHSLQNMQMGTSTFDLNQNGNMPAPKRIPPHLLAQRRRQKKKRGSTPLTAEDVLYQTNQSLLRRNEMISSAISAAGAQVAAAIAAAGDKIADAISKMADNRTGHT